MSPEYKMESPGKLRIKDIDENDLNNIMSQVRTQVTNELKFEMMTHKDPKSYESVKFSGNASEIYYMIIRGLTDYLFGIFVEVVKYSRIKNK